MLIRVAEVAPALGGRALDLFADLGPPVTLADADVALKSAFEEVFD